MALRSGQFAPGSFNSRFAFPRLYQVPRQMSTLQSYHRDNPTVAEKVDVEVHWSELLARAVQLAQAGCEPAAIQPLLGHASLSVAEDPAWSCSGMKELIDSAAGACLRGRSKACLRDLLSTLMLAVGFYNRAASLRKAASPSGKPASAWSHVMRAHRLLSGWGFELWRLGAGRSLGEGTITLRGCSHLQLPPLDINF